MAGRRPSGAKGSGVDGRALIPLALYLLRQRRGRWALAVLVPIVILAVIAIDRKGMLLAPQPDMDRYHGKSFAVIKVIDGDTFHLDVPDGDQPFTRVRFWGIDTPEMARRENGKVVEPAEPFAEEAKALTKKLCATGPVKLTLEKHRLRGNYGRLLAHIELSDGRCLNEELILAGVARFDPRFSHARLARYEKASQEAKRQRTGMWE